MAAAIATAIVTIAKRVDQRWPPRASTIAQATHAIA